ncbi:MAG: class I SAM-dependent RNA methyltransferase, partial [Clostridiales bacterium]|nr:class I SAM-dependent RNA methyltransferase [Clostridiales bacterium]
GVIICNPPYGERLGTIKEAELLYEEMGRAFNQNPTWSTYVITSYEDFEKLYGRRADAKRKLYNGMIKTDYYQFYGAKPPKKRDMEK